MAFKLIPSVEDTNYLLKCYHSVRCQRHVVQEHSLSPLDSQILLHEYVGCALAYSA